MTNPPQLHVSLPELNCCRSTLRRRQPEDSRTLERPPDTSGQHNDICTKSTAVLRPVRKF